MEHIIAVVSDIHANSKLGLCPPYIQLEDGYWRASKPQRWMWNNWISFWKEALALKREHKAPLLTIINGESADNNKYNPVELISARETDQLDIAYKTLEPVARLSDEIVVTRGTEAHVNIGSTMDEIVARMLDALPNGKGQHSWYHFRATVAGLKLDVAHHPGTGHMRTWTRGNDANRLAKGVIDSYVDRKDFDNIPDLILRAHNHKPVDSYDNHIARAIVTPSWQLGTSFGYRIGGGWLPTGGLFVLCKGRGKYDIVKRYQYWPVRPSVDLGILQEEIRGV